jgi:hypothetical protein
MIYCPFLWGEGEGRSVIVSEGKEGKLNKRKKEERIEEIESKRVKYR